MKRGCEKLHEGVWQASACTSALPIQTFDLLVCRYEVMATTECLPSTVSAISWDCQTRKKASVEGRERQFEIHLKIKLCRKPAATTPT